MLRRVLRSADTKTRQPRSMLSTNFEGMALKLDLDDFADQEDVGTISSSNTKLKINKKFANYYEKSRRSEELMKLKARYGDVKLDGTNEDDSDSETEDEDAEELTPAVEQKWLKTLAALKSNDPKLYDDTEKFFDDSSDEGDKDTRKKNPKKKNKKITLKDMDRKVILEREGKYSDNSSDSEHEHNLVPYKKGYYEEQAEIKKSILEAQGEMLSEGDEDEELLTVKVKTAAEKGVEEEEYRKFVKGQEANVDNKAAKALSALRDHWNRDDMSEADRFLKDYILEKKYLVDEPEQSSGSDSEDSDSGKQRFQLLSEDEDDMKKADQFELKYNFRFEEPDTDFIKSYPRTVSSTMRTEKNRRKEKRAQLQERKNKEKQKKVEELNRLKNLKKREIEDKLKHIMKKSGAENMPFTGEELDDDFDPDEHDRKMQEMFPEDENDDEDLKKPTFEFDPEIDDAEDWDNYPVAGTSSAGATDGHIDTEEYLDPEDPNFVMDADYDPNAATLEDRNFGLDGRSKRSKRKKNRLRKALEKKKPLFDPRDKTFEQYLEEYYDLEFEDTVGDLKCRFPYRDVPANDFGLTVGEILGAKDRELNSWSSLKKTVQYRSTDEEHRDIAKFRRKSHNVDKKKRMLPSVFQVPENDAEDKDVEDNDAGEVATSQAADDEHVEADTEINNTTTTHANNEQEISLTDKKQTKKKVKPSTSNKQGTSNAQHKGKKRKAHWKDQHEAKEEQSSRGMSFKRMEAYGMHTEVKRVKKLRARDKKRN